MKTAKSVNIISITTNLFLLLYCSRKPIIIKICKFVIIVKIFYTLYLSTLFIIIHIVDATTKKNVNSTKKDHIFFLRHKMATLIVITLIGIRTFLKFLALEKLDLKYKYANFNFKYMKKTLHICFSKEINTA